MKARKGFTLIELLVVIAIIAILAAILFPVYARVRRSAMAASCQSNLKQVSSAVKLYMTDWQDTYPTNRRLLPTGTLTAIVAKVDLSPPPASSDVEPARFVNGLNWVEELFPYIERISKGNDPASAYRCPVVAKTYPVNSTNACVSYAFNFALAEQPEGIVKGASTLMMFREMDTACWNSMLRPTVDSTGNSASAPSGVFLTSQNDPFFAPRITEPKQHSNGSHILFADGHVKMFSTEFFPRDSAITSANQWDGELQQWVNYSANSNAPQQYRRTIAITP